MPSAIVSGNDARYLENLPEQQARQMIQSWMPSEMPELSAHVLGMLYMGIKNGSQPGTFPIDEGGDNTGKPVAAVTLVPGDNHFGENYYRTQSSINFADNILSKDLLREGALFIAAHEATHGKLYGLGLPSTEYAAETGALAFLKTHPESFPLLKNPETAQGFLLGRRALNALFSGGGDYGHSLTAFLKLSDNNPAEDRMDKLQRADHDAIIKISQRLVQDGKLQPSASESFTAAIGRVTKPWIYTLSTDPANKMSRDLSADKTGILAAYLKQAAARGIDQDRALNAFDNNLSDFLNGKSSEAQVNAGRAFMKDNNISIEDLRKFTDSGKILAAEDVFSRTRHATAKDEVCATGESTCRFPSKTNNPSDPLVKDTIQIVKKMNAEGAFRDSPEQQAFADNVLAGAKFYKIPAADEAAKPKPAAKQAPVSP